MFFSTYSNTTSNFSLKPNRNAGLDIARIIAMIAVVILHSVHNITVKMFTCFCILLFVMVSGALWLDENHSFSINKLTKSILRIVVAFIFWASIYTIIFPEGVGIYNYVRQIIIGPYHFWYCYMIIGLYAILPIVKLIQQNKKTFIYFFIISFITSILFPTLSKISLFSGFIEIIDRSQIHIGIGYVFYFILGHLLIQFKSPLFLKYVFYFLGIVSCVAIFFTDLGADFNLLRMFYASAIFIFSVELGKRIKSTKIQAVLSFLSRQCFTVYLIHVLILNLLGPYIENITNSEFLYCIMIIFMSFTCASTLNIIWRYIHKNFITFIVKK